MDIGVTREDGRVARSATVVVAALAAAKLILHLATVNGYGIFRDELYYWACAQRRDWGYVDQPPMTPLLVRIGCALFGDTAFGIRFFAILAGPVLVWLTARLARELGAAVWGQALAASRIEHPAEAICAVRSAGVSAEGDHSPGVCAGSDSGPHGTADWSCETWP